MKISFDYDNTLTELRVQIIAMELIERGDDVYIISARQNIAPIFRLSDRLGIPRSRVFAVGSNPNKIKKIEDLDIQRHYDDNPKVIDELGSVGKLIR